MMKTTTNKYNILGIDIGRVIMAPIQNGKADTSFLSGSDINAMNTPPSPGAFDSIQQLVRLFEGRVWLVSKAGSNVQRKTRLWLAHHRFFERTGVDATHLRFCRQRHEKAAHCDELGITHFIDDRLDVLQHLQLCVRHRYLFGEQPKQATIPSWVVHVENWPCTLSSIVNDLKNREQQYESTTGIGVV